MASFSKQAKIDRIMSQRSLYYLCKEVLGYKDMVPHVHGDLCMFATHPRYGRFRQATVPRSWFKTWTLTVGKAIWLSLPDEEELYKSIYPYKGPNCRTLVASNVIDNAAKMINKIKHEWMENTRLKHAFPELIPDFNKTRWSDHCAQIKRPGKYTEGTYTAVGVGGSVISQHFDHIIEDDLVYAKKDDFTGMELMPNQEDIDNAIGWHKLAFSLLANPKEGCMDNVGTRWAPHDVIRYIRDNETHYKCFEITATPSGKWPIEDDTECIWPERYNKETLEQIRASQGPKIFETQYLNRPRAGEDVTFDVTCLQRHYTLREYPTELRWYTFVDLASWKDAKHICDNVILTAARDSENHLYFGRIDAGKYNPTQVIDLIASHNEQFDSRVLVEEVGYQVALRHFAKLQMQTPGARVYHIEPIPRDNRKGAKEMRMNSLEPIVASGMCHVLYSMRKFIAQLEDYPYCHKFDILDLAGFAVRHCKGPTQKTKKAEVDEFSIEAIEKEIKERHSKAAQYPFKDVLVGDIATLYLEPYNSRTP